MSECVLLVFDHDGRRGRFQERVVEFLSNLVVIEKFGNELSELSDRITNSAETEDLIVFAHTANDLSFEQSSIIPIIYFSSEGRGKLKNVNEMNANVREPWGNIKRDSWVNLIQFFLAENSLQRNIDIQVNQICSNRHLVQSAALYILCIGYLSVWRASLLDDEYVNYIDTPIAEALTMLSIEENLDWLRSVFEDEGPPIEEVSQPTWWTIFTDLDRDGLLDSIAKESGQLIDLELVKPLVNFMYGTETTVKALETNIVATALLELSKFDYAS